MGAAMAAEAQGALCKAGTHAEQTTGTLEWGRRWHWEEEGEGSWAEVQGSPGSRGAWQRAGRTQEEWGFGKGAVEGTA